MSGLEKIMFVTTFKHISGQNKPHKLLMARHETVNKKFKDWNSLRGLFRHGKTTHNYVLAAVLIYHNYVLRMGRP